MTSTSGNSGIAVSLLASALLPSGPRDPRRRLLGLLLRSAFALAVALVAEEHGREELLRVIRTFVANDVTGAADRLRGGQLLEASLVVASARARDGFRDPIP